MDLIEIKKIINEATDENIWALFAYLSIQLKERKLVRTRNIVGERGEFLAIETYNNTPGLPNLQSAPEGTQNIDAISRKGERYSVKTISLPGSTTGVFYGLAEPNQNQINQKFEYLIIVIINKNYELVKMLELDWNQFLRFKKWHTTMRAWNISITKQILNEARLIA